MKVGQAKKKRKITDFFLPSSDTKTLTTLHLEDNKEEDEYQQVVAEWKESSWYDERGIYYDGVWEDRRHGSYTVDDFDGPQVTKATVVKLFTSKVIGGNVLRTYKARQFFPLLEEGKQDDSLLGMKFFRDVYPSHPGFTRLPSGHIVGLWNVPRSLAETPVRRSISHSVQ